MTGQVIANELLRVLLSGFTGVSGLALEAQLRWRIAGYARAQERLRRRYQIAADTPIVSWGVEVLAAVESYAAEHSDARFAYSSGSTATPKKIAFSRARLSRIKRGSFSVGARLLMRHPSWRRGLFILSSLKADDSLTSLLLDAEKREPTRLEGLLLPGAWVRAPAIAELVPRYGAAAVRLFLLCLANPSVLYGTNPSTLAVFLHEVSESWPRSTALVRDFAAAPEQFDPGVRRAAAHLAAPGWRVRFARVAGAQTALEVDAWLPGLRAWCAWDGGYVRPFLQHVERHLPPDRARFIPMYSMSTETVETLSHFDRDAVRFLPIAPGVFYEFLPEGQPDHPELLLSPTAIEAGRSYTMVVSDPYGLRRYQTEDLFLCRGFAGQVPDLAFVRRRGLTWSFTGEKLTDLQLEAAFAALRAELPALADAGVQMTLFPSQVEAALLPGYRLVLAHPGQQPPSLPEDLGARFDRLLGAINGELASKLGSGRLAPTRVEVMRYDALAARLHRDADSTHRTIDAQFKLLPLYRRLWESLPP